MGIILEQLIQLLDLKAIETNVFVGNSQDLGFRSLFGGQVLGQALVAASRTISSDRQIHSMHGYFLRPGNANLAIYYEVDLIRSGKSFSTRRVVAKQGGLAIFSMSASFQVLEPGFEHQSTIPEVPGPEGILSELQLARKVQDQIPESMRAKLTADRPIEIRVIDPIDFFSPAKRPPFKYSWFRAEGTLPDQPILHQAMLAYASDFGLCSTAMLPHGITFFNSALQVASLDHAMWFHRPFRLDQWLLYAKDSPTASGSRGFNRGQIFTEDGVLVASVTQEGLMRLIAPTQGKDPMGGLVT